MNEELQGQAAKAIQAMLEGSPELFERLSADAASCAMINVWMGLAMLATSIAPPLIFWRALKRGWSPPYDAETSVVLSWIVCMGLFLTGLIHICAYLPYAMSPSIALLSYLR